MRVNLFGLLVVTLGFLIIMTDMMWLLVMLALHVHDANASSAIIVTTALGGVAMFVGHFLDRTEEHMPESEKERRK